MLYHLLVGRVYILYYLQLFLELIYSDLKKISDTKINSMADIGHPCLIPLLRLKYWEIYPLFETHDCIFVHNIFIHFIKLLPKRLSF